MENEVRQTLRLSRSLQKKIQRLAEKESRSVNGQIIVALQQAIEKYEHEHGPLDIES